MKEQMESLDKYERAVYVIMQNSRYDSNIINLSMSVKILLYDIKLKKERYPVSENLCLRRECKTTNKGNIPDPKLCDSMIKSVCYLRKPSIYKTVILSMTNEWQSRKQRTRSSMVTSKRIIYLIKIGVGTLVLEVAKCTDAEWSLSTKFRL